MKKLIVFPLVALFALALNSCDKAKDLKDAASESLGKVTELKETLTGLTSKLGGITDEATAEAAAPELEKSATSLNSLAGGLDKLPAGVKEKLMEVVKSQGANITALIEKVKAIPGVGDKVGPILEKVTGALAKFGA